MKDDSMVSKMTDFGFLFQFLVSIYDSKRHQTHAYNFETNHQVSSTHCFILVANQIFLSHVHPTLPADFQNVSQTSDHNNWLLFYNHLGWFLLSLWTICSFFSNAPLYLSVATTYCNSFSPLQHSLFFGFLPFWLMK